jgi:Xaa-Pro aminopeptidase
MYDLRLEKVRKRLGAQGIDCLALVPGFNLRYLTGKDFMLMERPLIAFIPADEDREPVLVIPSLEVPNWSSNAPFEARILPWDDETGPFEAMRQAATTLSGVQSMAVEFLRMRLLERDLITRSMPAARIVRGEPVLGPLRVRKDAEEISSLRRAIDVAEAALEHVVSELVVGSTEREIANRLTSALLVGGSEGIPFGPLVQSGPRSALPHGRTGDRPLSAGEILLIDFGATVDGYHSDITRTFVAAPGPDSRLREVYSVVLAANEAGRAAVRPGAGCHKVDWAARQVVKAAGYGDHFIHRTGHGLGLDVHEDPGIVAGNQTLLEEGMVFTIEPGVYLEGWGGVRVEDDMVVTEDGCESLTSFSRELRVVGA